MNSWPTRSFTLIRWATAAQLFDGFGLGLLLGLVVRLLLALVVALLLGLLLGLALELVRAVVEVVAEVGVPAEGCRRLGVGVGVKLTPGLPGAAEVSPGSPPLPGEAVGL